MPFWFCSLPLVNKRKEQTWELLQEKTTSFSKNAKFNIPELRVGTLDTLMQLSDDLAKTNNLMEIVVTKLRRQIHDLSGSESTEVPKVKGQTIEDFVSRFSWNEAKYQAKRPLKELAEVITEGIARIEDDLKVKISEYNNMKGQLSAVARKAGGSLAVRDISTMVKPSQIVDSENMTTVFVVVGKFALKEWETSYEKMCNFVVPRSSKHVSEDNDYILVSAVLFKRVLDDFKTACRAKGFQVREYKPASAEAGDLTKEQVEQLGKDVKSKKAALEQWSRTAFEEAFSSWVHLVAIRMFVESILRYGLPPAYQAAVVIPKDKSEARLRQILNTAFGAGSGDFWTDDGSGTSFAGLAGDSEMFPYVSFTISLD